MTPKGLMGLVGALFLVILALDSFYIVNETERAVLKRFQQIVKTDIEPNIHFKWPFIDQVIKVDGRTIVHELPGQSYLTSEKKLLNVNSFVIWRVVDVQRYVTVIGGGGVNTSERMRMIAEQRLNPRVAEGLRNEFATHTVQEVVAGRPEVIVSRDADPGRALMIDLIDEDAPPVVTEDEVIAEPAEDAREALMDAVAERVNEQTLADFGIEVVDVRVKQVDWPDEVRGRVFDRMRAERSRDAARHRSEGREAAERIRAAADRQRTVLLAEAFRQSEQIRGAGDAEAANIYAGFYNRDREFYSFYRSLQAYRNTFRDKHDVMVLEPDGEFFRYLKQSGAPR